MPNTHRPLRKRLSMLCAALVASAASSAFCEVLPYAADKDRDPALISDEGNAGTATPVANITSQKLAQALQRGLWTRACSVATDALARQEQNLDALGVFAVCRALVANKDGTESALSRLLDVEPSPGYYATLTRGVSHLRNRSIEAAEVELTRVLKIRPGDPIALYFQGEVLHARHKDSEAIGAFTAALKTWPDYSPALSASARLTAAQATSANNLNAAISMSEHAARIEPMNLKYWEQTAALCDRAGQHDRAKAIRLQWLSRPNIPAK